MARKRKLQPRRKSTGLSAGPTNSFYSFLEYVRLDVDRKELIDKIKVYVKSNFSKSDQKIILSAPEWAFAYDRGLAATIYWSEINGIFPQKWDKDAKIRKSIAELKRRGQDAIDELAREKRQPIRSLSPAEISRERISDFIAEIEHVLDSFGTKLWKSNTSEFSIYNELLKVNGTLAMANAVIAYYQPIAGEFQELIEKKTPDLVEGYSYMSVQARKQYLAFLNSVIADAQRFALGKKATRAPRKPKTKTAVKQVERIQYLPSSAEFKLTSVHPETIVGAERVLLFNTKTRVLTELVNEKSGGFQVKGTTIQGIDAVQSRSTKLRKPDQFLPIVMIKTPLQYSREWKKLTTKTQSANGRINKDTIILRALNK